MLAKNIFGILILLFNMAGLVFFLYLGTMAILEKISPKEKIQEDAAPIVKKPPIILKDNIIPDEDDLLKDMDLSDLDNLNLDDFE